MLRYWPFSSVAKILGNTVFINFNWLLYIQYLEVHASRVWYLTLVLMKFYYEIMNSFIYQYDFILDFFKLKNIEWTDNLIVYWYLGLEYYFYTCGPLKLLFQLVRKITNVLHIYLILFWGENCLSSLGNSLICCFDGKCLIKMYCTMVM